MPSRTRATAPPQPEYPTSIRLPADLKRRLQQLAKQKRQPLSSLIVYVMEQYAKAQEGGYGK